MRLDNEKTISFILNCHNIALIQNNNLKFIKKMAKDYFNIADKEFNEWYLHFLPLYWKEIDDVKRNNN